MTLFVVIWKNHDGETCRTEQKASNALAALRAFRRNHGRREILGISSAAGGVRIVPGPDPVKWLYNLGSKPWPDLKFDLNIDGPRDRWIMVALTERGEAWIAKNIDQHNPRFGACWYIERDFGRQIAEHARHQGLLVYGGR
jgi:hypothetical protein